LVSFSLSFARALCLDIADHLSDESLAATEGPNKDLMEKQRLLTRAAHSDAQAFRHGSAARANNYDCSTAIENNEALLDPPPIH
jgi:hypothetical protein